MTSPSGPRVLALVALGLLWTLTRCGGEDVSETVDVGPDGSAVTCDDPRFAPPDCTQCAPGYAGEECRPCVDGEDCDDGDPCTVDDRCVAGACRGGGALDCDDAIACTEDSCVAGVGCTHAAVDARCVDADPCTEGGCDPVDGCRQTPLDGASCSDGNPCTDEDRCVAGACVPGPNDCVCDDDGDCPAATDRCVGALVCDVEGARGPHHTCAIDPTAAVSCADTPAPPCQTAVCDPATGACVLAPAADGEACDDGDVCTEGERCRAGACVAAAFRDCDDADPCTLDRCHFQDGCRHEEAPGAVCDDGDPCTGDDRCGDGACAGTPLAGPYPTGLSGYYLCGDRHCEDGVLVESLAPDGRPCSDVVHPCRGAGSCQAGVCVPDEPRQAGTACHLACAPRAACDGRGHCVPLGPDTCDDGDPCTVDTCADEEGCVHTPRDGGACDDGDPCTAVDVCVAGRCAGFGALCPCGADADCAPLDDGWGCTGVVVCDQDGTRGGRPANCLLDRSAVPDCHPWPAGSPEGVVGECVESAVGPRCDWRLEDDAPLLYDLQAIYKGAVTFYSGPQRVDRQGEPLGRDFPDNQNITPVEATCCGNFGGPDFDYDGRCDHTSTYFGTDTWAALGFRSLDAGPWQNPAWAGPHRFLYEFMRTWAPADPEFTVTARQDVDCTRYCQHRFTVTSGWSGDRINTPAEVVHDVEGDCRDSDRVAMGAIPFTTAQRVGFAAADVDSLHPFYPEVATNLQRILEGAVAAYERQPTGACTFPDARAIEPAEGTCCSRFGGPDLDGDGRCDAWTPSAEDTIWDELDFSIPGDFVFAYQVQGWADRFEARAYSDLDCDSVQSTFIRFARAVESATGCDAEIVPGIYTVFDVE